MNRGQKQTLKTTEYMQINSFCFFLIK